MSTIRVRSPASYWLAVPAAVWMLGVVVVPIVLLVWGGVGGLDTGSSLLVTALGCLFMFVAFWLVSSRLVVPIASAVGQPSERIAGAAGRLALRNSQRNPVRTARTAAALMIGRPTTTYDAPALSASAALELRA